MLTTPLWLQGGTYPARIDRQLIYEAFGRRELVLAGLTVAQTATASISVVVSIGSCTILGDDETNQGMYLVYNDAVITQVMPAVPGSTKRIDLVSVKINDPQAGGAVGNNATIVVTQGAVAATPVAPVGPASSIPLVQVVRTAGDAAVTTAMITDVAGRGIWPYQVSTSGPPAKLPANYVWIKVG